MSLYYVFLLILFHEVFSAHHLVVLDDVDSSFVIAGQNLIGEIGDIYTFTLIQYTVSHNCQACTIAVVPQFTYVEGSNFTVKDSNTSYSAADFHTGRIVYMLAPITVTADANSVPTFALTFTLMKPGVTFQTLGILQYGVTALNVDGSFQSISTLLNNPLSTANTLVAPDTPSARPFMMIKEYTLSPGCAIDVFSGGFQSINGDDRRRLTTLFGDTRASAPSVVLSTGLSYVVPPHCAINITVVNMKEYLSNVTVKTGQTGFLMSPEYPGSFDFNKIPGYPSVTTLKVEGGSFANVTFDFVSVDAGDGGSLSIGSDVEPPYVLKNVTNYKGSIIGGRFTITWTPGKAPRGGYLVRYVVNYYNQDPSVRHIELSPEDSSFAVHGKRMIGKTLQLTQKDCNDCTIEVVAEIYDIAGTEFVLKDAKHEYSKSDLKQKSVSLIPPAVAIGLSNSSSEFVLTFTLLKPGQTLQSLGYNLYTANGLAYGGITGLSDLQNVTKREVSTWVAANTYDQPPHMQISDLRVAPWCSIDVFVGGLQTINGKESHRLITMESDTVLAPSTIRSSALTYVTPQNCPYNITVYNAQSNVTISPSIVSAGQTGFLMSTGYPGTRGWMENGEGDNTTEILNTKDAKPVNITFDIVSLTLGLDGYLVIGSDLQGTYKFVTGGTSLTIVGGKFTIRYSPGINAQSAYLIRYTVVEYDAPAQPKIVILTPQDSSFVIHGARAVGKIFRLPETKDCMECTVRVDALIDGEKENVTYIIMKDNAQNTYTVSDISQRKPVFLVLPASVEVYYKSANHFVLSFTLLQPGNTFHSLGVDTYSLHSIASNGILTLSDSKGSVNGTVNTIVVTNAEDQPPTLQIMRFNVIPGCPIDVFIGGFQSINGGEKHRLVTLSSAISLAPSVIRSTALTYFVPPVCRNNFTIGSRSDDPSLTTVSVGQTGFLMSSGYPGSTGFQEKNSMNVETTRIITKDGKSGNFSVEIVSLDGGELQIQQMSFSQEDNKPQIFLSNELKIKWTPGSNPRGFLIRYTVTEDTTKKDSKGSSLRSLLQSITVLILLWCY